MKICLVILLLSTFSAKVQSQYDGYFLARSTGKLTMLSYGLGEDRLGGAKLGYIDTSVLLKVIDSTNDFYQVRLSKLHNVYINKYDLTRDTSTKERSFYLTNSFSVKGDDEYDYVHINIDEKLPYKSWMEINPSKILLEIYGVQANTNWITQLKSATEIKEVYFNQIEDDVLRVTVELRHKQHWGYSLFYTNKILSLRIRRPPTSLKVKNLSIAIDAGHGGSNAGATGVSGKSVEKNYTLRFATELEQYLRAKGATVIMTRTSDTNLINVDRVLLLRDAMPDILISLHLNSSANPNIKGVSTYYKHIGFRPFAKALLNRMLQLELSEFGEVGNFNFTLSAPTDFPNSLIEIAFLSNAEDERKIIEPRFQKAVAKKVYKGIKDWLKLVRE
jgi:N-acetylmuramoyl-L-alanine amidase